MIPSTGECLASVVRALTDVVLPSLPPEAGLAREQVELSLGHLQIIGAQLDLIAPFEVEELADACALGRALAGFGGGPRTGAALAALDGAIADAGKRNGASEVRAARIAVHDAIAAFIQAVAGDGDAPSRVQATRTVIQYEKRRVAKDRAWFAPFGFDIGN